MSYEQFGNTWWGQKWLQALQDIDFSNRLPRGKSYARNGSVLEINILGNKIRSKVQGRLYEPYEQEISLKPFSQKARQTILDVITKNPYYLSQLLNRELPFELFGEFSKYKIQLFPSRWSDLEAYCSCPDWAVPCKHLASVIYMIANEIDRNPFLIFELHGMDILEELRNLGYEINSVRSKEIRSMSQILIQASKKTEQEEIPKNIKNLLQELDFSKIPELWQDLTAILPPKPLFILTEDFRIILSGAYKAISRKTGYYLERGLEYLYDNHRNATISLFQEDKFEGNPESINNIDLKIADDLSFIKGNLIGQDGEIPFSSSNLRPLIEFLHQIPSDRLMDFPAKIALFNLTYRFSLSLLKTGSLIPELLEVSSTEYAIRWVPARMDQTVREFSEKLIHFLPADSVAIMKEVPTLTKRGKQKRTRSFVRFYPSKEEQFYFLSSLFLSYFVEKFFSGFISENRIRQLFFGRQIFAVESFEDKEIPALIQLWLNRFTISERTVAPVLKITEGENGFGIEILVENRKDVLQEPLPLKEILDNKKYAEYKVPILKDLALLSDLFPEIEEILDSGGSRAAFIFSEKFAEIFFMILPVLQLLGIRILLPKALQHLVHPKLSISVTRKGSGTNTVTYLSLDEMLAFDWKIALGDELFSYEEFQKLVRGKSGIVRIRDQFVWLDEKDIQKLLAQAEKQRKLKSTDLLKVGLEESFEGQPIEISEESRQIFRSLLEMKPAPLPRGLRGKLRPYQKRGYQWLLRNASVGFGSIIADDMGLGKTVQVIALLLKLKNEKKLEKEKALVIVPTTLLTNWKKEIERFAPGLKPAIYHGLGRTLNPDSVDVVLTTYGIIRNENDKFIRKKWAAVVIDEAQNIKNATAAQTRSVKKIKANVRIAMTGTPVENRLLEYWSIFDFTNKGYLGNQKYFKEQFAYPIEVFRDQDRLNRLLKITSPFIMRRLKNDKSIIKDLPEKLEFDKYCSLAKDQAALYQNVVDENLRIIKKSDGISRRGMILKLITSLKQICNHPSHFLKQKEIDPNLSGKTSLLVDLLKNIYDNDEKVIIFTQYRKMGELLLKLINEVFGKQVPFLHGAVPRKKRDEMVDLFQNEKRVRTMILSLKAGGTGLNLTAAKNVIHFDLWWNPAVETQATDRAYRIGQTKDVLIYRLLTQGTFEEKINEMLLKKKELAELAVSKGEKWIGELSDDELTEIVRLEK